MSATNESPSRHRLLRLGLMPARLQSRLLRWRDEVDNLPLVYLRIAVGIAIYSWAGNFLENETYRAVFIDAKVLFKYPGFEWVRLWPGDGMRLHFQVIQMAALALTVGFLTRLTGSIAGLGIAYVLLVERQIYVNHYYLLANVAIVLSILPSGRRLSIDAWLRPKSWRNSFPNWQLWLLRFQLGIPYLFGAIAKLNGDWMRGQPAELILSHGVFVPWVGDWSALSPTLQSFLVAAFVYGGFFYDLLIVPALLYRRTRPLGVACSFGFHLTNAAMLNIGVFPWFMLTTIVIFFPADWFTRRWRIFWGQPIDDVSAVLSPRQASTHPSTRGQRVAVSLACVYVIVHLLLPLRPILYAGDSNWNERGHRFAWRMMLRHKTGLAHFLVVDNATDDFLFVPSSTVLTGYQMQRADHHPELLRQTAKSIALTAREFGVEDCRVYALALVSLNGRKPTPMIRPDVDLMSLDASAKRDEWLIDDPGPFLEQPWSVPKEQWWTELTLPAPFQPLQDKTPSELLEYLRSVKPTEN